MTGRWGVFSVYAPEPQVRPFCSAEFGTGPCLDNARWQVGPLHQACDTHLHRVIRAAYKELNPPVETGWPA